MHGKLKSRWHADVVKYAFKAMAGLNSTAAQRSRRVFVPMLTARPHRICCALSDLSAKVGASTPLDVFVWSIDNAAETAFRSSQCNNMQFTFPVSFLNVSESWKPPATGASGIHHILDWGARGFSMDYRRMGHWRLIFQFAFADILGYRYLWQLDDDSFFLEAVTTNMLQYVQQNQLWIAAALVEIDPHSVLWGLPELTRTFLVAERLRPAGMLFKNHTTPPGLQGLYTVTDVPGHHGERGGWSRAVMLGNNVIMDLEKFWWPHLVQKFVELAVHSGYHFRFRWNEQAVISMAWQVFVPERHFQAGGLPMNHTHPRPHSNWSNCSY
jgi:hypothetical protein